MPSPPSPRGWARASRAAAALALVACAAQPPPAPRPSRLADEAYLLPPESGYPLTLDADTASRLSRAHALLLGGDIAAARATASDLLARQAGLEAAWVLAAEADIAGGDFATAVARLDPIVRALPDYTAARLALGRAAERLGDVAAAYEAFRGTATPPAPRRAQELLPRAIEVVANRVADALRRGRVEDAQGHLAQLRAWAPDSEATVDAEAAVAGAAGDRAAELQAVRRLAERRADQRALLERQAALELAVGDPGTGVEIYERLVARYPRDPGLADALAAAKFRWRLALLPPAVRRVAERPALTRAEFAALLFWTVPEVRYGRAAGGRIAADVLDHALREEIVRVVNLGLMDVDRTLHRFAPERGVARVDALQAVLRLLASHAGEVACVAAAPPPSRETACALAAACRLLADAADCLPEAPLAGGEALGLVERALELLPQR